MSNHKISYEIRITFEDNTRVNFNGERITEFVPGVSGTIRLRHTKVINAIADIFKAYISHL